MLTVALPQLYTAIAKEFELILPRTPLSSHTVDNLAVRYGCRYSIHGIIRMITQYCVKPQLRPKPHATPNSSTVSRNGSTPKASTAHLTSISQNCLRSYPPPLTLPSLSFLVQFTQLRPST